jgi:starvation-inducible DNA-binding protein
MSIAQTDEIEISLAAVSGPQREKNHQVLQPTLTDLIALGLSIKQLHWNVIGPYFRPIHLHLDEIFEEVEEGIDRIAERMSATGHSPDGRLTSVAKNTELDELPEGFIRDSEVLLLASHRLHVTVGLIRDRLSHIEDVDTVTADLLHNILEGLEKHHWMIQAQRV